MVENEGQRCLTLCRAVILFKELNALLASTSKAASVLDSWKCSLTECAAASQPAICPAHICKPPAVSRISSLTTTSAALAIILRAMSPMPIGLTPGHLSRAIKRFASKGATPLGST